MNLSRKLRKAREKRALLDKVIGDVEDAPEGRPFGLDRASMVRAVARVQRAGHAQFSQLVDHAKRETIEGDIARALGMWYALGRVHPTQPAVLFYLALAAYSAKDGQRSLDIAVDYMALALQMIPPAEFPEFVADAAYNLGRFHEERQESDEAIAAYLHALQHWPAHGQSLNNLGSLYFGMGDTETAERLYDAALQSPLASADARYNISFLKMTLGRLAEGFTDYESRWDCAGFAMEYRRDWMQRGPRWDGSDLNGRRLFVCWEQGFGDTIQMWRYVHTLHARIGPFHVEVQPALYDLLRHSVPDGVTLSKGGDPVPVFDTWTTLMSLPFHFGGQIPEWRGAYLRLREAA